MAGGADVGYTGPILFSFFLMSPQQTFEDALSARDWAAAEQALSQGADIEAWRGSGNTTAFFAAVAQQDVELARWLKDHGANVKARNLVGDSALMALIQQNGLDVFRTVLDWGFDLSAPNNSGVTPVMQASLFKHGTEFMAELLKRGANPSHPSASGANALLVAAASDQLEMVQLLLDANADPLAVNYLGQNLLYCAVDSNNPRIMKLILDRTEQVRAEGKLDVNHSSHGNSRPVARAAAAYMNPAMVVLLMRAGADLNARDADLFGSGLPPLSLLAFVDNDGDASLVKEALARGANPRLRDYRGQNAFGWAIVSGLDGKREVLQALIEAGLDPTSPLTVAGHSPLHVAVWSYKQPLEEDGSPAGPSPREVVRALMDMGFPTFPERWQDKRLQQAQQEQGVAPPPLALALATQKMDLAEELLAGGTPLNTLNSEGKSVLHFMGMVKGYSENDLGFLEQARKVVGHLSREEKAEQAKKAQAAGELFSDSGVAPATSKKMTPKQLEQAQQVKQQLAEVEAAGRAIVAQAAQWLCDQGANWELKGYGGVTPSMEIAERNGVLMLGQLVKYHGVSLLAVDDHGFGVADYAWKGKADETLMAIIGHCQRTGDWAPVASVLYAAVSSSPDVDAQDPQTFVERSRFIQRLRLLPQIPELIEYRDEEGNTPLIVAAATKQDDVVQLLLAMGADVKATNHMGETALHHAVDQNEADMIRQLRWAGADPEAVDSNERTPRSMAKGRGPRVADAIVSDTLIEVPELQELSAGVREAMENSALAWERLAPLRPSAPAPRRRLFA